MSIVIGGSILAVAFFVPFALRVWAKFHWLTAWLVGALVLPTLLWIAETLQPSGWGWVIMMFWGIPVAGVAAIGAGVGSLVLRKRDDHVAS